MVERTGLKDFKISPNEFTVKDVENIKEKYEENFYIFNESLKTIWELVSSCDKYIEDEKPWAIEDIERKREIFSNLLYSLKNISEMIDPFLPKTAEKMRIGLGEVNGIFNVKKGDPLFPIIEIK